MASVTYPSPTHNARAVTEAEYEQLVSAVAADGLVGTPDMAALAYADGTGTRAVKVRANRSAVLRGFRWDSGAVEVTLNATANAGATRLDLLVLRLNRSTWQIDPVIIAGVSGGSAPSPVQNAGPTGSWDLPLAVLTVTNGATTISSGQVAPAAWYINEDGTLLCTPTTRPPHIAGRIIRELTTYGALTFYRDLLSNGSAWRRYGLGDVETWAAQGFSDGTAVTGITSTSWGVTGTSGGGTVGTNALIIPPSGAIKLTVLGRVQIDNNSQEMRLGWHLGTGGTYGVNEVWGPSSTRAIIAGKAVNVSGSAVNGGSWGPFLVPSLTPGANYWVRLLHSVSGGTGSADYRGLLIEPVP